MSRELTLVSRKAVSGPVTGTPLPPDLKKAERLAAPFREFRRNMTEPRSVVGRFWSHFRGNFRSYFFMGVPEWRMQLRRLQRELRARPQFASIGSVRSGTSALSEYLLQHPCVVPPIAKEPPPCQLTLRHMLAPYPRQRELDAHRARHGMAVTGFCAPIIPQLSWPHFIKAINPTIKVIAILRDPVERAYSHWRWDCMLRQAWARDPLWKFVPDFREVARLEMESIGEGGSGYPTISGTHAGYLADSIYLSFMRTLFGALSSEQVHIINASDFFEHPACVAREAYAFLGLPDYEPVHVTELNSAPPAPLEESLRGELARFFDPFNRRLYDFLGRDLGWTGRESRRPAQNSNS